MLLAVKTEPKATRSPLLSIETVVGLLTKLVEPETEALTGSLAIPVSKILNKSKVP